MDKTVVILTSGHPPFDERIYYKFAFSLRDSNFRVVIICSTLELKSETDGIVIQGFNGNNISPKEKIILFQSILQTYSPDLIICCEPLPILAANRYRKQNKPSTIIIADITEWYPENVALKLKGFKKLVSYILLTGFNIYCINQADALIIGEITKKSRYNIIAPYKEKIIIGYYPVLKYFKYSPPLFTGLDSITYKKTTSVNKKILTLCYAGLLSLERGLLTLVDAASTIAKKYPGLQVKLKIMGKFQNKYEEDIFDARTKNIPGITTERVAWVPYPEMSSYLEDVDLCFDLRIPNFIYRNSLPIKIFEYMACGKPYIFSDVEPIRKELKNDEYGTLVDPNNKEEIVETISNYIEHPALLMIQSMNARKAIEGKYNWESQEARLVEFIFKDNLSIPHTK